MTDYPTMPDESRADFRVCLDRAQRAIEVAEVSLSDLAEALNDPDNRITVADVIAHADARTRVAMAWTDLAEIKAAYADE